MAVQTNAEGVIIRGKSNGTVFQQWHGMQVRRTRKIPTNPRSPRQLEVRADLVAQVAGVKNSFATPGIKQMWSDWAALNPFPKTKRGYNVVLPAYSAALKVAQAAYQFDLYAPTSAIPTTSPPQEVPEDVVVTADDNTLTIAWGAQGSAYTGTNIQIWVCGPFQSASPHAVTAKPEMARLIAIETIGALSHTASIFFTAVLDFAVQADYCVWARLMRATDSIPGPWAFLGNFTVEGV